jgi:NTE family protein
MSPKERRSADRHSAHQQPRNGDPSANRPAGHRRPQSSEPAASSADSQRIALVLSGGGARGAYEAGVLSVLVPALARRGEAPTLFVGSSVGAINAAGLAASWHDGPEEAVATGLEIWRRVDKDSVIRPILSWQIPITVLRYAGGVLSVPKVRVPSLLDPAPLRENLGEWIDWAQLHRNMREGTVSSVGVVATAARSGRTVVFVEGERELVAAAAARRSHVVSYVPTKLAAKHVRASAAIPIFFPPVRVEHPRSAAGWYIDGGTRLNTPLKPALDLGAERMVVVGMDSVTEPPIGAAAGKGEEPPDFGDGALHVLQGRLVDPVIEDVRMLGNANVFFSNGDGAANAYRAARGKPPYRVVPYIFIAPERHGAIGKLASEVFKTNYNGLRGAGSVRGLRNLATLRGTDFRLLNRLIGDESPTHGELLSYLFFDRDFIEELIEMGRKDARRWLTAPPGPSEPWQIEPLDRFLRAAH